MAEVKEKKNNNIERRNDLCVDLNISMTQNNFHVFISHLEWLFCFASFVFHLKTAHRNFGAEKESAEQKELLHQTME